MPSSGESRVANLYELCEKEDPMKWFSVVALGVLCAACSGSAPASSAATAAGTAGPGTVSEAAPVTTAPAATLTPAAEQARREVTPAAREVALPAGTTLRLALKSAVGSDTSRVEDAVRAELRSPVVIKGETILPAGTELTGVVTDVKDSGRVKGRARVAFRFASLSHRGERYTITTAPIARQAAASKGDDAKKIAIGAGAGAALGALLGGGGGAAKGAALGGAGGTGVVLATKGKAVHLSPGAVVTTRLTAPLTVRVKA
jgi:hypothetical protein